ncbi:MAG: hypothetical protein GX968_01600 [Tissierellia bacterium]|nr:hypothetical protein [Tissierellia bacterium]
MLNIFFNIIGLFFIIISIVLIKKTSDRELAIYEEILIIENNIKSYSAMIENILNNFDKLMDSSLDKLKSIEKQNIHNVNAEKIKYESIEPKNSYLIKNKILAEENIEDEGTNEFYSKIIKLAEIGLNSEEIARKLNVGIREVEIFLKIWDN